MSIPVTTTDNNVVTSRYNIFKNRNNFHYNFKVLFCINKAIMNVFLLFLK